MISLKPYNTFGVESFASNLMHIHSEEDLFRLDMNSSAGIKILGGGSNILLTGNIPETILRNEIKGVEIIEEDQEFATIKVGAGEKWHEVVLWALSHELGGIENLSLIPGCAGAAPVQNIGAYGVELKDVFLKLEGISLPEKKIKFYTKEECQFSYRNSIFKSVLRESFFITKVYLKLSKHPQLHLTYGTIHSELAKKNIQNPTIHDVSAAVVAIRTAKLPDPAKLGNAGSFFKNSIISMEQFHDLKMKFPEMPFFEEDDWHVKIPSGWLIEQCGWKGKRIGDTGCYEKQALVLVNYGNAKGAELLQLAENIIASVKEKFGIILSPEVNIW